MTPSSTLSTAPWIRPGTTGSVEVRVLWILLTLLNFPSLWILTIDVLVVDWPARKTDIGGPDVIYGYPFNFFGDVAYENITLQYPLSFPNFSEDLLVADVMDIHGGPFCYEYK